MTQENALNILVSAVRLANKRGAFEIEESAQILDAIKVFMPQNEEQTSLSNTEVPQETTQEG
jgi:hypothetical protein